ncbi:MAG: response regulator [Deferribacterales bacterium]
METNKPIVLYVEDEDIIRGLVAKFLEKHFEVITAANGCEALEKFNSQKADFIVTDITMPKMNGIKLIKALKEIDGSLPVFVTTAHTDEYKSIDGVEQIYGKPLDCRKMIDDIKNHLNYN